MAIKIIKNIKIIKLNTNLKFYKCYNFDFAIELKLKSLCDSILYIIILPA